MEGYSLITVTSKKRFIISISSKDNSQWARIWWKRCKECLVKKTRLGTHSIAFDSFCRDTNENSAQFQFNMKNWTLSRYRHKLHSHRRREWLLDHLASSPASIHWKHPVSRKCWQSPLPSGLNYFCLYNTFLEKFW